MVEKIANGVYRGEWLLALEGLTTQEHIQMATKEALQLLNSGYLRHGRTFGLGGENSFRRLLSNAMKLMSVYNLC